MRIVYNDFCPIATDGPLNGNFLKKSSQVSSGTRQKKDSVGFQNFEVGIVIIELAHRPMELVDVGWPGEILDFDRDFLQAFFGGYQFLSPQINLVTDSPDIDWKRVMRD